MDTEKFIGCFVSYPSLEYGASEKERLMSKEQGDLFRSYIWGKKAISDNLKKLKSENYGKT